MNPLEPTEPNPPSIKRVVVTEHRLTFDLEDGRSISAPLDWYPTLRLATPAERQNFEVVHSSVHWPDLDCDLSSDGLLRGAREDPRWARRAYERHFERRRRSADTGLPMARKPARRQPVGT
jgi:hypothetical protein